MNDFDEDSYTLNFLIDAQIVAYNQNRTDEFLTYINKFFEDGKNDK